MPVEESLRVHRCDRDQARWVSLAGVLKFLIRDGGGLESELRLCQCFESLPRLLGVLQETSSRTEAPKHSALIRLVSAVCAAQIGEPHEENRVLVASHRNVDPSCRNASNPYHHCSDYCWTRTSREKEQREENRAVITERKEDKKAEKVEMEIINPKCANALNPYHKCADYCFNK
ncbi:hypothetical protein ZIOFF_061721 [Zingiber officinale]|uniref:Uncharacterized protein n=1 Tax=Zingiber officinale TaxID=94328 RepID=A0A8J5KA19_ZINOF|nr:hypothetical protein ZIOFF_061721 [Zingiber officinale]